MQSLGVFLYYRSIFAFVVVFVLPLLANAEEKSCSIDTEDCYMERLPKPEYPPGSEELESDCVLHFTVNPDGTITPTEIHCDNKVFEKSVSEAALGIRYSTHDACNNLCEYDHREIEQKLHFRRE